jgi:hypothetical protein
VAIAERLDNSALPFELKPVFFYNSHKIMTYLHHGEEIRPAHVRFSCMKNFPHQINQLPRLTRALGVFIRLVESQGALSDDGVVGDALAKAGVYTFRTPGNKTVDELLAAEHRKSTASQGTRACARDLRRFFILLGFIRQTHDEIWEASSPAKALWGLEQEVLPSNAHDIWRQALLDLELADSSGSSHPYRILLRLVVAIPGLPKPYSGLCLEARNDSEAEFDRIRQIATRASPSDTMNALAGEHMARNSIKILPSIAEQLGDIRDDGNRLFISDRVADAFATYDETEATEEAVQRLVRRPYAPRRRVAEGQRREPGVIKPATRSYDPDLLGARYNAHEDCLDRLSNLVPVEVDRLQAIYDLLLVIPATVLLVEAKTIRADARRQVRAALGQLLYYEHFDVAPLYPDTEILRLVLTDSELAEDLQKFLTKHQIGVVWMPGQGKVGGSQLGLAHLRKMGANA